MKRSASIWPLLAIVLLACALRPFGWAARSCAAMKCSTVSLQLPNGQGAPVVQQDQPLAVLASPAQASTCGILVPKVTLPGAYQSSLVVYDPTVAAAPRLLTADGYDSVELSIIT